jgi:hypothetical protein
MAYLCYGLKRIVFPSSGVIAIVIRIVHNPVANVSKPEIYRASHTDDNPYWEP